MNKLWIGEWKTKDINERFVVYDPEMQTEKDSEIYLLSVYSGRMEKYNKKHSREGLIKIEDKGVIEGCIAAYIQWREWHGAAFQKDVLHMEHLSVYIAPQRNTKCWNCKAKIASYTASKCDTCGWLKCPYCGACKEGCPQYSKGK